MHFTICVVLIFLTLSVTANDIVEKTLEHHVFMDLHNAYTSFGMQAWTLSLIQLFTYNAHRVVEADAHSSIPPPHMRCAMNSYKDVIFGDTYKSNVREVYSTLMILNEFERKFHTEQVISCAHNLLAKDPGYKKWSKLLYHPFAWADKLIALDVTKLIPIERGFYFYALWELFGRSPFPPRYIKALHEMMRKYNDEIVMLTQYHDLDNYA